MDKLIKIVKKSFKFKKVNSFNKIIFNTAVNSAKLFKLEPLINKFIFILILSLIIFSSFIFKSCAELNFNNYILSEEEKSYLAQKKVITFTGQINYAPFEFIDKNNEYTGIMIDLVRWIATEFGFKIRFLPLTFNEAQNAVLTGKADVITSLFYSKTRDRKFDFTKVVFKVPAHIYIFIDRYDINNLESLQNKKIVMQKGDYAEEFLNKNNINVDILYVSDFYQAVDKIVLLEADALIGDDQVVLYHIFNKGYTNKIKKMGQALYIGSNCMAVKENNKILLNILNKGINKAIHYGIKDKITQKWLGVSPQKTGFLKKYKYHIIITFSVITFIVSILLINNWYLRNKVKEKVKEIIKKNEELEKSEATLRTLINSVPDIICLTDENDKIIEINDSFLKIFSLQKSKLKELQLFNTINSKNKIINQLFSFSFYEFKDTNNNSEKIKLSNIRKEVILTDEKNNKYIFEIIKVPLFNNNNEFIGGISIGRDITRRKKIENELLKIQKLDSLKILAGRIAHDFNNFLSGVIANLNLAKLICEGKNTLKELYELITEAENAALSAKNISTQLLTFSKGGHPIKELVEPVNIIKEAINFTLRGSKSKANLIVKSKNIYTIYADKHQLLQAINNILINADQAMPEGGEITIILENKLLNKFLDIEIPEMIYLIITIKDQGIGIPAENLSKIFDPFYSTKENGNGLGLFSVYTICKSHNGFVFVQSQPDRGSTFFLLFPSTGRKIETTNITKEKKYYTYSFNIILLDDEKIIHNTSKNIFTFFDCKIDSAYNAEEFISMLKKKKYDIAIMDLVIPGSEGGDKLIKRVKENYPDLITIVSSGYSNNPAIANYKKFGFDYFLKKPFSLDDVENLLYSIKFKNN